MKNLIFITKNLVRGMMIGLLIILMIWSIITIIMAGVGYANEDESSLTFISGGPVYIGDIPAGTGVDVELLDEAYTLPFDNREIDAPEWMKVAPESWKHETLNTTQIIDLLTRCKDDIRASIRETEILANLYNSVATDGSKVAVDRSSESFKLLEDIEAALKALQ